MSNSPMRVVVLISGSGTNLQAIIDGQQDGSLPIEIAAVISNKPGVKGLQRAETANIATAVVDHKQFESRESFDAALQLEIDKHQPQLVVLAGFMRILTPAFTAHYAGKMLNIHPSLLPKYQGLHTHQRAIDAGDSIHGVTVHFVTAELDGGPAAIQAQVKIDSNDTADTLAAKVQVQEHIIYPLAVKWFAEGRLHMQANQAWLDGKALPPCGHLLAAES
ncbi:phosphoribosylglycinamide formyltransferase [Saccharophagus degradans]|uniref:phosphoribosylglycinamide formyltransferase n=1 Tax=Saccharophagus degradans TaxID=86304 RepID=UPI001C0886BD|nr:phosphoribosylglycinamide formyltransferase [Saccharophagus degradans]MBU2984478.1 phosphoribosylglycinamide formyltransferase [Saccharophagus degradans]